MEIKHLISEYSENFNDSEKTTKAVKALSNALCMVKDAQPALYTDIFRCVYAELNGSHYNEHLAMHDVMKMHHKKNDGTIDRGEHFPIEKAHEVMRAHGLSGENNVYDVYVAINANYHDRVKLFASYFPSEYERKVIEDAITFYFKDEDAPEGKIFKYITAMYE